MIRALPAFIIDLVLVCVFVVIGRASHKEAPFSADFFTTLWPFAVALFVGWAIGRAWRHPLRVGPNGVVVWVFTVGVGILLRYASGQGVALAFILVAAGTLAVFLLGWRAIAQLVMRGRRRVR